LGSSSGLMDAERSPAEELPALYRAILDGVARLEGIGQRREAATVRTRATAIYSTSWDDRGRRRLEQLQRRIDRVIEVSGRSRTVEPRSWRSVQPTVEVR
jgi:hypothetical protein